MVNSHYTTGCKFKTLSKAGGRILVAFGLLALSETTPAFTAQPDADLTKNTTPREIILIDKSVKDYQVLIADLKAGQQVVYIGVDEDPLKKLLNLKHHYQNVSALHIVSHGKAGGIRLGDRLLTKQTLNQYSNELHELAGMFTPDGDIMLYGCDVAAGWQGRQFVSLLGELTRTDVAASNDKTGASALSGDWELEFVHGSVDSEVFYPWRLMQEQYAYVLPTFDFDNPASSGSGTKTVTQTVSGVTLTASIDSGFGNWFVTPVLNGSSGWTGNILVHGSGATNSQTFTFSSAVDITSIRLGDQGTPQNLVFTPTSGTTYIKNLVNGVTGNSEVFSPADWTGVTGFVITLQGGGVFYDTIIDDIVFTLSNTAPTVSGVPSDVTVTEDTESNINLSATTFADADADNLTVTLTASAGTFSTPVDGSGVGSGVTETWVSATQITLAGAAADINTYLDSATNIKYTGASNVYGNNAAAITISATDGTDPLASNPVVNIDITAVNDSPTITNLNGDSFTFTEGDTTTLIDQSSNATVADVDSTDFKTGALTVTLMADVDAAEDLLSLETSGTVALAGSTAGSNVSVGGKIVGTLGNSIAVGNDLVVNFSTANATASNVQTLVRAITYQNRNTDAPTAGARIVRTTISDGDGGTSTNADVTVTVLAINDDPAIASLPGDISVTEDTSSNVDLSATTLSDADSAANSITLTIAAGAGTLTASSGGGVSVAGSGSGSITLSGTAVNIDTFLNTKTNIQYTSASNANGNNATTLTLTANDGGNTGAGGGGNVVLGTVNVDIAAVGDTPSITDAITNKNIQSTSGLVISRNANDGAEVTHYKITSINGGTLYKNDGTTVIANNAFITVAEGAAGLKFTPATNSTANGTFNVQAGTDGVGGGLSAGSASATITVTGDNNPPTGNVVITGGSNPPLVGETLTADTSGISDADGLGTFSYQWERGGSSISGATSNTYPMVMADVGNAIRVTVSYTDGDSTLESITSAATAAVDGDFDGDGIGDATDPDDDNDGMTDVWELAYGLDPKDASDASGDRDGDGVSNLDEFIASSDPTADDYAPVVTPPVDLTIDATGLFTAVDIGIATATDDLDGALTPTSDAPGSFPPGVNTVTWSATDAAGNTDTATQIININPLVNFSKDQVTSEGSTVNFSVILNGNAVTYPVSIPYTVSGTAATDLSDHDLVDGTATINSGTEGVVSFTTVDDGAGEGRENIVVTMGAPTNAAKGANRVHTIDLIEGNVAPTVSLSANQGAGRTRTVTQVDGLVTVASSVFDPNNGDTHTYDWSMTDNALIDTDGVDSSFSFDPSGVSVGVYTLRLNVSDGNAADEAEISINVVSAAPVLTTADSDDDGIDDQTEGYGDSDGDGVAEYLDAISSINVLQEQVGVSALYLIETEPGLTLSLGRIAFQAGNGQARVSATDITNAGSTNDDTAQFAFAGGLFDFTVSGLPVAGQSASIVLAQLAAIPANAVYRKLTPGGWQDFVVDTDNAIASAPGVQGYCPPPGDAAYQTGLTEGHWCVQLTIKDGGPNDGDGEINNSFDDPGGVATILSTNVNVKVSSSGGIGSLDLLWLVLFTLLGIPHFLVARKGEKH